MLCEEISNLYDKSQSKKIIQFLSEIPLLCRLNNNAAENRKSQQLEEHKYHPVSIQRGEVIMALITEGVGAELCGQHLVVIIQNKKANIYSSKVNVLPIEGDGLKINPAYQMSLCSSDLITGSLDKNPSRIIMTDILTLDKSRLARKIGVIKPEKMAEIDKRLKIQLGLK